MHLNNKHKTTVKQLLYAIFIASTAMLFGCSGGSVSGGVYGQTFNVTGVWAGQISDGNTNRALTLTLGDTGEAIAGTMLVVNHSCLAGASFVGTATKAPVNTPGDNPLTADQENQNSGTVNGTTSVTEIIGDESFERVLTYNMTGNSSYLIGRYSGNWMPQWDQNGTMKEIPGFENNRTCRGWFEGNIVLYKQSQY